jgi:hypothetical protein
MRQLVYFCALALDAGLLFPLDGQDPENQMFNFNVGGGLSVPLNPTGRYLGVTATRPLAWEPISTNTIRFESDFMWSGLSPSLSLVHPIDRPTGSVNLYTVTGNYRFHIDSLAESAFGVYVIGGGGWYYRHTSINKNYIVPLLTVC